jgi:hypothetical protein
MNPSQYTLRALIDELCEHDPDQPVKHGFGKPHSYRGYYDELAFEPVADTTVGAMLEAAREADCTEYQGYKGGDYIMDSGTPVWLAHYGDTGETLGKTMLALMLVSDLDTPTN